MAVANMLMRWNRWPSLFVWVAHMEQNPVVTGPGGGVTSPLPWHLASDVPVPGSLPAGLSLGAAGAAEVLVVDAPRSFTELYEKTYDSMVRLAYVILGSADAAEELVQDAFIGVHERWDTLEKPEWYLRRSVVNGCRDRVRRQGRFRTRVPLLIVDAATITRQTGRDGERRDLVEALRKLPVRQRAAVVLRFYGDHSEAEIADALGVKPGTVKSLVHRGLEALRDQLREEVPS